MHILLPVAVSVVLTVMGCPPQGTSLHGSRPQKGKKELHEPRGTKGSVTEISMIKTGDGKHAHHVKGQRATKGNGTPAGPKDTQAAQVQKGKGENAQPLRSKGVITGGRWRIGIEPSTEVTDKGLMGHGSPPDLLFSTNAQNDLFLAIFFDNMLL
jgi:hypothetical protein